MRLFNFAIASIVDVHTRNGTESTNYFINPEAAIGRAHSIRSRSVHSLWHKIRDAIGQRIEDYRERAQQRRELKELMGLNDRLLSDIGLTRGDLLAIELGGITLTELYAERRRVRDDKIVPVAVRDSSALPKQTADAANEEDYLQRKCA